MKIIILTILIMASFSSAYAQDLIAGIVIADHYECKSSDHIVIQTNMGFTLAEVYSGYGKTLSGHSLFGKLHSFGFKDIYDKGGNKIGRLWIDDYYASKATAAEWCYEG